MDRFSVMNEADIFIMRKKMRSLTGRRGGGMHHVCSVERGRVDHMISATFCYNREDQLSVKIAGERLASEVTKEEQRGFLYTTSKAAP